MMLMLDPAVPCIPHICHFFYTGRIFESLYFTPKIYEKHPKITVTSPKKCKICCFSHSIWKILHRTEFFDTSAYDKYEVWYLVVSIFDKSSLPLLISILFKFADVSTIQMDMDMEISER